MIYGDGMVNIPEEVKDYFNNPQAAKVIATVDEQGNPHVAPVGSLQWVSEDTFAFAVVSMKTTKENLEKTKKAALLAFTAQPFGGYKVYGSFVGFQTEGALFDTFAKAIKEMLNVDISHVGIIRAEGAEPISLSP